MPNHEPFQMHVTSDPRYLTVVRAAVESAAKVMRFSGEDAAKLAMVVDEAVTNIIRHGYCCQPDQPIHLSLEELASNGRSGITIILEDESTGVDLSRIQPRAIEDVKPGGLGVHIIREVMDEVEYSYREQGPGVRLRMCKYNQGPNDPVNKR